MSKILILVERFYPEDFLVNDLAAEWKRQGHDVEVLTQVPSYPFDRIYDGYENKAFQTTLEYNGIPVHRVSTVFGYNRSVKRKILNYLHFALMTSLWALWNGRRFDKVFIYHTAALTMASAAIPLKLLWRKQITIWTQDLWPDAVWGFGFRRTRLRETVLEGFVRLVYAMCSRITVSCRGFVQRIKELTGRDAEWIPQWEPTAIDLPSKSLNGKTVFMFAGNMGVPQNLENVIEGFVRASIPDAELWLVGGGVMLEPLKGKYGNRDGVKFCGRQPRADMPSWFANADVLIISLSDKYGMTLPGKFQTYIKTGKSILGILTGEARDLIAGFKLGEVASPDNLDEIAEKFSSMHEMSRSGEGKMCGERAKWLSERMFNRELLIRKLLGE